MWRSGLRAEFEGRCVEGVLNGCGGVATGTGSEGHWWEEVNAMETSRRRGCGGGRWDSMRLSR